MQSLYDKQKMFYGKKKWTDGLFYAIFAVCTFSVCIKYLHGCEILSHNQDLQYLGSVIFNPGKPMEIFKMLKGHGEDVFLVMFAVSC